MNSNRKITSVEGTVNCGDTNRTIEPSNGVRSIRVPKSRKARLSSTVEPCLTESVQVDEQSSSRKEGQLSERSSLSYLDSMSNDPSSSQQNQASVQRLLFPPTAVSTKGQERREMRLGTENFQPDDGSSRRGNPDPFNELTLSGNTLDTHDSHIHIIEGSMIVSTSSKIPSRLSTAIINISKPLANHFVLDSQIPRSRSHPDLLITNEPINGESDLSSSQNALAEIQIKIFGKQDKIVTIRDQTLDTDTRSMIETKSEISEDISNRDHTTSSFIETVDKLQSIPGHVSLENLEGTLSDPSVKHEPETLESTNLSPTLEEFNLQTPVKGLDRHPVPTAFNDAGERPDSPFLELNSEQTVAPGKVSYLSRPSNSQSTISPGSPGSPEATFFWDETPLDPGHSANETPLTPPDATCPSLKSLTEREPDSPLTLKVRRPPARPASQLGAHHTIQDPISHDITVKVEQKYYNEEPDSHPKITSCLTHEIESNSNQGSSGPSVSRPLFECTVDSQLVPR